MKIVYTRKDLHKELEMFIGILKTMKENKEEDE